MFAILPLATVLKQSSQARMDEQLQRWAVKYPGGFSPSWGPLRTRLLLKNPRGFSTGSRGLGDVGCEFEGVAGKRLMDDKPPLLVLPRGGVVA